jgi:uncharacterized protein (TIGR01370 family)
MKALFRFVILSCFIFAVSTCCAWQVSLDRAEFSSDHKGLALLDPDQWNRKEISQMKAEGIIPVAWLNVGQIEAHRLLAADIKEKDIVIKRRYSPQGGHLARFYSPEFLDLTTARVNEYLQKGFMGILFARSDYFSKLSNSYVNKSEMISLLARLKNVVKSLDPKLLCIVHNSLDFFADEQIKSGFDGIIIEGLFNTEKRKHIHPWQRQQRLSKLKAIIESGKKVWCIDYTVKQAQKDFVIKTSKELGFNPTFHRLPLTIKGEY